MSEMPGLTSINILLLEDNESDLALILYHLRKANLDFQWQQAATEAEFVVGLTPRPDLILADYRLPGFDGLQALRLLRARRLDIPFILVSGTVGEEVAVEVMKEGAADYLLKDRLIRLEPAIRQAISQHHLRRQRRHMARALKSSEARYRRLVEHTPDGIAVQTAAGLSYLNQTGAQLLGATTPETLLGGSILALVHPNSQAAIQDCLAQVTTTSTTEVRLVRLDGSDFEAELILTPFHQQGQDAVQIILRDITVRTQLERQLRQAQKLEAVGRLAGGVAHDFNNLLTAILGYSTLIERNLGDHPIRADLAEISNAAQRAADLTRQLLAFSRQQVMQPRQLDVNAVVVETERLIRRLIGEDIEFVTELSSDLGLVLADPGQLTQVILNLAINARDAMPDGGRLTLRTISIELSSAKARHHGQIKPGPYLRLTMADTGHGMDADTQTKIFDPFFTTKEIGKGTGLGLSTVHGIVQQSGGFITVESEPGQGAAFHIFLPQVSFSPDEPTTAGATVARLSETGLSILSPRTILVVEDEASVRQLVKRILTGAGYSLYLASDGVEALELSRTHPEPIDLLLTDMILPGDLNGYQLAQLLLAQRPGLKVIYTSGYTDRAVIQDQVIAAGLTFLQKPFPPQQLLEAVRQSLMTTFDA